MGPMDGQNDAGSLNSFESIAALQDIGCGTALELDCKQWRDIPWRHETRVQKRTSAVLMAAPSSTTDWDSSSCLPHLAERLIGTSF